jgi:GH43 family beta-xylosidase
MAETVTNPVRENAPDPTMVWYDGNYYLTYTGGDRIALIKAPSVTVLAKIEPTTVWLASQTPGGYTSQIWAPELHFLNDHWYLYYAAQIGDDVSSHRMFVLESRGTDPLGPYTFKAKIPTPDFFAIDGTVLRVGDRLYFVYSGVPTGSTANLYIAPMSDPWTLSATPVVLSRPSNAWEQIGDGEINEGPYPLYHDGRLFLTFSASHCATPDYALGLLTYTGGDPLDPASWSKSSGPVFAKSPANGVYGPGHNGIFTSPDGTETWLVYHATANPAGNCSSERSTRIQKIDWNADGSPNFGIPADPRAPLAVPSGDPG